MTPTVVVGFPWRATPEREPAFDYVLEWWQSTLPDAELVWADTMHQPFNLNAVRNAVVDYAEAAKADVVVICDADVRMSDPEAVHKAIQHSWGTGQMAKPYGLQRYLTAEETTRLIAGEQHDLPGVGHGDGCVYIVQPKQWRVMHGADERFIGYGGDDYQIVMAAETFIGLKWFEGTAWSLHHADECRPIGSPAQQRNARLADVYGRLRHHKAEMLKFIETRPLGWEGTGGYE